MNKKSAVKAGKVAKGKKADEAPAQDLATTPIIMGVVPKGTLAEIPVASIIDPPGEPDRMPRPGDEERIRETARSLREVGQLQPIMVERIEGKSDQYRRVFGRRRLRAAVLNNAKTIMAIVVDALEPSVRRTIVAVENIQRQDITPIEEHLAVHDLVTLQAIDAAFAVKLNLANVPGIHACRIGVISQDDVNEMKRLKFSDLAACREELLAVKEVRHRAIETVAAMLAKPVEWVRDRMYIGRMGAKARELMLAGKLPLLHAREIAKLADEDRREELAEMFAIGGTCANGDHLPGLIEELRDVVGRSLFTLTQVPWRLDVSVKDREPCVGCKHNSQTQPHLFEAHAQYSEQMHAGTGQGKLVKPEPQAGVCTNPACYRDKLMASNAILTSVAKKVVDDKGSAKDVRHADLLQPGAISKKVEARREASKHRKPIARGKPQGDIVKEKAKDDAYKAWQLAHRARTKAFVPMLADGLRKDPLMFAAFLVLKHTKLYEATAHHEEEKAKKAVQDRTFIALFKHVTSPSLEGFKALALGCGREFGLLDEWDDGQSGLVDLWAKTLNIKVDPAPDLASMTAEAIAKAVGPKPVVTKEPVKKPRYTTPMRKHKSTLDTGDDEDGGEEE